MYPLHKGERSSSADHGYRVAVAAFAYKCTQWIWMLSLRLYHSFFLYLISFTICFSSHTYHIPYIPSHIDVSYRPRPGRYHFTVQYEWFMSKKLNPAVQRRYPLLVLERDVSFVRMRGERIEECHGLVAPSPPARCCVGECWKPKRLCSTSGDGVFSPRAPHWAGSQGWTVSTSLNDIHQQAIELAVGGSECFTTSQCGGNSHTYINRPPLSSESTSKLWSPALYESSPPETRVWRVEHHPELLLELIPYDAFGSILNDLEIECTGPCLCI